MQETGGGGGSQWNYGPHVSTQTKKGVCEMQSNTFFAATGSIKSELTSKQSMAWQSTLLI